MNVAFWAHVDGLDDYVALLDIADELDVEEFTEDEFLGIFGMTLGELVQLLMSRPVALPKPPRKWGFKGRSNV